MSIWDQLQGRIGGLRTSCKSRSAIVVRSRQRHHLLHDLPIENNQSAVRRKEDEDAYVRFYLRGQWSFSSGSNFTFWGDTNLFFFSG
jgi:hypothetical protein